MVADRSLKTVAIGYLSRREHSRQELRRKLAAISDDADAIEAVLDELQRGQWQSDARYAQSYVHRKAGSQGARRILQDLREQGVDESGLQDLQARLRESEPTRALAVWQRRFGALPADAREYARQYRFMAQRGFSADAIRQVLTGRVADMDADDPTPEA